MATGRMGYAARCVVAVVGIVKRRGHEFVERNRAVLRDAGLELEGERGHRARLTIGSLS